MVKYKVIGVMSGTSCDGLDLAVCDFWKENNQWNYQLGPCETFKNDLFDSVLPKVHQLSTNELIQLDHDFGKLIAQAINDFLAKNNIQKSEVDYICSHGHTVFHQPQKGYTLQIGNGNDIKAGTGIPTIFDFRSMDVAHGGQGAPLVPIGDELLFHEYDLCINLGGIANYSKKEKGKRIAQDICFVGMIINRLANEIGLPYDEGGQIAKNNPIDQELLSKLLALNFNGQSLAIESYEAYIKPLLNESKITTEEKIATCTAYAAIKISEIITPKSKVLMTGGGAYNDHLIDRIKQLSEATIIIPEPKLIEYKEALIFGFLGVLKLENTPNCLSSVTGAARDNIGGVIV